MVETSAYTAGLVDEHNGTVNTNTTVNNNGQLTGGG